MKAQDDIDWREIVKTSDAEDGRGFCHFCSKFINGNPAVKHYHDCPWLLAQDEGEGL